MDDLIKRLRDFGHVDAYQAANSIEQLKRERDEWMKAAQTGFDANMAILERAQNAEAQLANMVSVLRAIDTTLSYHEYSETGYTRHYISTVLTELEGKNE